MTSSNQPVLAVVIPIYGHPSLLLDAVESALRQDTEHDYRVVLVNDGCPSPQSDLICRQYVRAYPHRVLYVHKRNGGLSSARNRGVRVALEAWPSVRAVYLLDADNRIRPQLLRRGYDVLRAAPDAGWVFPDVQMFGATRLFSDTTGEFSRLQLVAWNYCEAGSLVRRELFERGVAYDESMKLGFEDWEFFLQGLEAGFVGRHGPALGFLYRKRPESMLANSERDRHELTGYIRRKHMRLGTMRQAKLYEDEEMPRFGIYLADRSEVVWTSDTADLSRRLGWDEFARSVRRWRTAETLQHCPPVVVVTREPVLRLLEERGVAANVFWTLEADLESADLCCLTVVQSLGVEVRLELSGREAPSLRERLNSPLCALPTRCFHELLADPRPDVVGSLLQDRPKLRVAGRRLRVEHLEPPVPLRADAVQQLVETAARHGPAYRAQPLRRIDPRRAFFRTPTDAGRIARHLFNAPAAPPLHVRPGLRHLAFVVPLAECGGAERVVCNLAREAARQGWRVHLFVIGSGRACLLAEFAEVFASVHLVPDEHLTQPERLVSLLGTMHAVVNSHSPRLYAALGELKRLGVKLITRLHLDESPGGMPWGDPYLAVDYEHSLHKVMVASEGLRHFLLAKGVPPEKLLYVPNAPGFDVAPERIDTALAERVRRPDAGPLRVLYMGRFDPQKGSDRLVDLVRESERRGAQIEWRIVGNSTHAELDRSPLKEHRHPPATDVFSLVRHYCWADVLLLVSRYEGAPLTILEAQQLGCVPVATNSGAVAELIDDGETGFLLDNIPDTDAFTRQALELLERLQQERDTLRGCAEKAAAVRHVRTWKHTTRELTECLEAWFPGKGAA
jgi:glycosyltransferase involved in cell wall biosynthesis